MTQNRPWVLASSSPRRRDLLGLLCSNFEVIPSQIEEIQQPGESPSQMAQRLAKEKAVSIRPFRPESVVIGADTVVVCEGQILGKPASPKEARSMLQKLSGRSHEVITGLCVLKGETVVVDAASTIVRFSQLSGEEIEDYLATGEPFDKAGGYATQGKAARFVEGIDGCFFNVVGLPVSLLYRILRRLEFLPNG
jgi:nucleoside triphosphate pyrophosphatase